MFLKKSFTAFPCLTCNLQAETTNASTAFRRSRITYVKRKRFIRAFAALIIAANAVLSACAKKKPPEPKPDPYEAYSGFKNAVTGMVDEANSVYKDQTENEDLRP